MPGAYIKGWDDTNKKWVKCEVTTDGKLIINPGGFLENPPTEDEDKKAPTSEWAFDHDANAAAHHAKYTDAESRAAINNILSSTGEATANFSLDWHNLIKTKAFVLQYQSGSTHYVELTTELDNSVIKFRAYKPGTGYVDTIVRIYDGSVFKNVIHAGTFQAELDNYLETSPTEDSENTAPTSEWAFDHDADPAAHHAKYTDKEAVDSFKSRSLTITTGTETSRDISAISMILLDTGLGDITLEGFDGGYQGQIVLCLKDSSSNDVIVDHNSANAAAGDKILCYSGGDETMATPHNGMFYMIYNRTYWFIDKILT